MKEKWALFIRVFVILANSQHSPASPRFCFLRFSQSNRSSHLFSPFASHSGTPQIPGCLVSTPQMVRILKATDMVSLRKLRTSSQSSISASLPISLLQFSFITFLYPTCSSFSSYFFLLSILLASFCLPPSPQILVFPRLCPGPLFFLPTL